jgi:iron complex outermembrane receptor protein
VSTLRRLAFVLAAAAIGGVGSPAAAQEDAREDDGRADEAGFGATGAIERPIVSGAGSDPTAAATSVRPDERPHAFDTADELLLEVPGAQAWLTGAYGAFRTLSLRGAGGEHTAVLLGDMPLAGEGEAFDLSLVPVALLDRVEVYRGGAPVWLGAGAIGGVLRLVPRSEPRSMAELTAGVGSFGLLHARVATSVVGDAGTPAWTAAAGAVRSDGDFPYTYDPTELVPGDEREVRRENGHVDEGHGLAHLATDLAGGTLEAAVVGVGRTGGVPGPAIRVSNASRAITRVAATTTWRAEAAATSEAEPAWRGRMSAGASYGRDAFSDRYGEIGFGRARITDDRTQRLSVLGAGDGRVLDWLRLATVVTGTHERLAPEDALAAAAVPSSERWSAAVAGEARIVARPAGVRLELRPSARVRVVRTELHEIALGREGQASQATRAVPTARLGAVVEPMAGVAIGASVATETRVPTFVELFGDRAFVLGDARLRPERAVAADVGALARGRAGIVEGRVEARGFATFVEDLIRYRRTAQNQALPENVGRARILGVEAGGRVRVARLVGLVVSGTLLSAEDRGLGRQLPLRPRFQGYVRPELYIGGAGPLSRITVYADVAHVGAMAADPHNVVAVPPRTLFGAGVAAELFAGALGVAFGASDLTDERPFDVLGFPLPGRSFELTVTGRTERW